MIRELVLHASAPSVNESGHMVQSFTSVPPAQGAGSYDRHRFAPTITEVPGGYLVAGPVRSLKIHDGSVRYVEYEKVAPVRQPSPVTDNGVSVSNNAQTKRQQGDAAQARKERRV